MKIIGFNLTKILVEKEESQKANVSINQNINIKDISKEKISITDEEVIKIQFNLVIEYSDKFAKIEFEGSIIILPEKDELKQFLNSWKDKKIATEIRVPLFNFIMNKCNVKALYLEDEMSLPYHIPMPRINMDKKKS